MAVLHSKNKQATLIPNYSSFDLIDFSKNAQKHGNAINFVGDIRET